MTHATEAISSALRNNHSAAHKESEGRKAKDAGGKQCLGHAADSLWSFSFFTFFA
ncbi:MAG: hypothetical protein MSA28_05230 [Prevotella sp.]|nr:hypothetical protein [Prevotella sp.]